MKKPKLNVSSIVYDTSLNGTTMPHSINNTICDSADIIDIFSHEEQSDVRESNQVTGTGDTLSTIHFEIVSPPIETFNAAAVENTIDVPIPEPPKHRKLTETERLCLLPLLSDDGYPIKHWKWSQVHGEWIRAIQDAKRKDNSVEVYNRPQNVLEEWAKYHLRRKK